VAALIVQLLLAYWYFLGYGVAMSSQHQLSLVMSWKQILYHLKKIIIWV